MPSIARRGVLMTATARKTRASWRDQEDDEDDDVSNLDSGDEKNAAKASQLEWDSITREVREERRKKHAETHFAHGNRDVVTGYDDVADDAVEPAVPTIPAREDPDDELPGSPGSPESAALARGGEGATAGERALPPEGASTAGLNDDGSRQKTRGGKKKTGSQKKRDRAEADAEGEDEDGNPKKRRRDREEEDDKKYLKLRLDGEEKTKKIKASRIVHYHDYDSGGVLFGGEPPPGADDDPSASSSIAQVSAEPAAPPAAGNFRAGLRLDLWGDDDSEE